MNDLMQGSEAKKVLRYLSWAVLTLTVFLAVESLVALKDWRGMDQIYNSISVSGEGEFVSVPDIATFSFTVSSDSKNVSEAQGVVTENSDAIFAGLKSLGVEDKDIKTVDYSVWPKYVYASSICAQGYCPPGRQIPDGYTVSQTVSIKVRDTSLAGEALAVVGDKGATNISGLTFTSDDSDENMNKAREMAIEDAKMKAKELAKSLGVRLVRVVNYSDSGSNFMPMYYSANVGMGGDMEKSVSAPSLPTGENKTKINVVVTYEIR